MKVTLTFFFGLLPLLFLHSCGTSSSLTRRLSETQVFGVPQSVVVQDSDHFTFAFVGDLHIGGKNTLRLELILSKAKAEGDAFVIFLGDIIDKGEEQDYIAVKATIDNSGIAVFPAIGNHDVFEAGWDFYGKYFGPSRYSFTAGNSRFIVIDTADGTVGEEQKEWLEGELAKSATNTFIASHYLPVIPGIRTYLKLSNDREALRLMKLADQSGVRAWLGGHYHSFVTGRVGSVNYVVAGGGGGRRMQPILDFFFAQATISGNSVTFQHHVVQ